jgi:hypothetical protein
VIIGAFSITPPHRTHYIREVTLGNCRYCGRPAGFLRSRHKECEREFHDGQQRIVNDVLSAIKGTDNFAALEAAISEIEKSALIPSSDRNALLAKGWENAVESFLDDKIMDLNEEVRLVQFMKHFGLAQDVLDKNGAFTRIVKAGVLRDILEGEIPQRLNIDGKLPINFQKDERLVWAFPQSDYLEDQTHREYEGSSHSYSWRIIKGVYYRTGQFQGHPVEKTERVHVDSGWVVVTDKNIYFAGPSKSVRIPFTKIVSFEPYSNGIGVMRDSAKPQIFVTGDGWFTCNLITNLAQL